MLVSKFRINIISRCGNCAFRAPKFRIIPNIGHQHRYPASPHHTLCRQWLCFCDDSRTSRLLACSLVHICLEPLCMAPTCTKINYLVMLTVQQIKQTWKKRRKSNFQNLHCHINIHLLFILVNEIFLQLLQIL
jgi:hypothetical protein